MTPGLGFFGNKIVERGEPFRIRGVRDSLTIAQVVLREQSCKSAELFCFPGYGKHTCPDSGSSGAKLLNPQSYSVSRVTGNTLARTAVLREQSCKSGELFRFPGYGKHTCPGSGSSGTKLLSPGSYSVSRVTGNTQTLGKFLLRRNDPETQKPYRTP